MTGNQIAYWKYAEDVRHNAEAESQGRRNLSEMARHNLATEGLTARQIGLGYAQLAETRRANTARELLQSSQLEETVRSNMAKEAETNRSNEARERETTRHNERVESMERWQTNLKHTEWDRQFEFDKDFKTTVQVPLEVGKALVGMLGTGTRLITGG